MFKSNQIIYYPTDQTIKSIISNNSNSNKKAKIKKRVHFNEVDQVYYTEKVKEDVYPYSEYEDAIKLIKISIEELYEILKD